MDDNGRRVGRASDETPAAGGGRLRGGVQLARLADESRRRINDRLVRQGRNAFADALVEGVGHVQVAGAVHGHAGRPVEPRRAAGAIGVAGAARESCQRRDGSARRDQTDRIVGGVGHIDVAGAVHGNAFRVIELRRSSVPVRAARGAGLSRQGCNHDLRDKEQINDLNLPDRVVVGVRHIRDARRIHRQAVGIVELRHRTEAIAAAGTVRLTRQRGDGRAGRDLPDGAVASVRQPDVAAAIHRQAGRIVKTSRGTVPGSIARLARPPGQRGHCHVAGDLADGAVGGIGHKEIAAAIHGDAGGIVELRRSAVPVRAARGAGLSRQGPDHAIRTDEANGVVAGVGHIDVGGAVHGHAKGVEKARRAAGGIGTARNGGLTGPGRDDSAGRNLPGRVVAGVRHPNVAEAVRRDAGRKVEQRCRARSVGAARDAGLSRQRGHHPVGRDLPDGIIAGIRHIDIAEKVHRDAIGSGVGATEPRGVSAPVRAAKIARPAGQGGHHAGGSDLADRAIAGVRHVHVGRVVHRHRRGLVETGIVAYRVGAAGVARLPGQRGHQPGGGDLADSVVPPVGDIDVAGRVHRHAGWMTEPRRAVGSVGAARVAGLPGQRGHCSGGGDFPDDVIPLVGHIHVSGAVHRRARRSVKARRAAVSVRAVGDARQSRQGRHRSVRPNLANRAVARVRHVQVAGAVHGHAGRMIEPGGAVDAVQAAGAAGGTGQRHEGVLIGGAGRREQAGKHEPARERDQHEHVQAPQGTARHGNDAK